MPLVMLMVASGWLLGCDSDCENVCEDCLYYDYYYNSCDDYCDYARDRAEFYGCEDYYDAYWACEADRDTCFVDPYYNCGYESSALNDCENFRQ